MGIIKKIDELKKVIIRDVDYWKILTLALIIGWSSFFVHIGVRVYDDFSEKVYQQEQDVVLMYKTPKQTKKAKTVFATSLFEKNDPYSKEILTKKQFISRIGRARGVKVITSSKVDYSYLYLAMLIITLAWFLPTLFFLLLGIYLKGTKHTPIYDD